MSEESDNRKLESVKRGLTLIGETTSLEIIEHFERNNLPRDLLILCVELFGLHLNLLMFCFGLLGRTVK